MTARRTGSGLVRRGRRPAWPSALLFLLGPACAPPRERPPPPVPPPDANAPDPDDLDGDGYTPAEGDCKEYNPLVNPGAFEAIGNEVDDDCDGLIDNPYADCDDSVPAELDAAAAAEAMNICPPAFIKKAEFLATTQAGTAIRTDFGPNISPRSGKTMLLLATGLPRVPAESGFVLTQSGTSLGLTSLRPAEYATSPGCSMPAGSEVQDAQDLKVVLRAPTNAKSLSFELRFFTAEYPDYYCSDFNDAFAALMRSTTKYKAEKNIAYGESGELLSVNVSFWSICNNKDTSPQYLGCEEPPSTIDGSGYGAADVGDGPPHGATRWLTTTAPVVPGEEITLKFVVWDEGDGLFDSAVLLDNFRWGIEPTEKEATIEPPK